MFHRYSQRTVEHIKSGKRLTKGHAKKAFPRLKVSVKKVIHTKWAKVDKGLK